MIWDDVMMKKVIVSVVTFDKFTGPCLLSFDKSANQIVTIYTLYLRSVSKFVHGNAVNKMKLLNI